MKIVSYHESIAVTKTPSRLDQHVNLDPLHSCTICIGEWLVSAHLTVPSSAKLAKPVFQDFESQAPLYKNLLTVLSTSLLMVPSMAPGTPSLPATMSTPIGANAISYWLSPAYHSRTINIYRRIE